MVASVGCARVGGVVLRLGTGRFSGERGCVCALATTCSSAAQAWLGVGTQGVSNVWGWAKGHLGGKGGTAFVAHHSLRPAMCMESTARGGADKQFDLLLPPPPLVNASPPINQPQYYAPFTSSGVPLSHSKPFLCPMGPPALPPYSPSPRPSTASTPRCCLTSWLTPTSMTGYSTPSR